MIQSPFPAIAILLMGAATLSATEPIHLTYRPHTGATVRYRTSSTLGQNLTVMGRDVISEVSTTLGLVMTVRETLMQRSTIELAWQDGKITVRSAGAQPMLAADSSVAINMHGLKQRLTLTPKGTVIAKEVSSDANLAEVLGIVESTKIPDRIIVPFPAVAVSPGDQWTSTLADTAAAPHGRGTVITKGTITYTFRGLADTLGRHCWVIDLNSADISQQGSLTGAAIEMRIDGSGSMRGTSVHDSRTGLVIRSATQLETRVHMTGQGMQEGAQNISVPVHSQVNVIVEREE